MKILLKILALVGSMSPLILVIMGRPTPLVGLGIALMLSMVAFVIYVFHIFSNQKLIQSERFLWTFVSLTNLGGVVYWVIYILPELKMKSTI